MYMPSVRQNSCAHEPHGVSFVCLFLFCVCMFCCFFKHIIPSILFCLILNVFALKLRTFLVPQRTEFPVSAHQTLISFKKKEIKNYYNIVYDKAHRNIKYNRQVPVIRP